MTMTFSSPMWQAADERAVVAEAAVAAHLHEVVGQELEIVERVGPRRMAHDLHALPRGEVGVELPARSASLASSASSSGRRRGCSAYGP